MERIEKQKLLNETIALTSDFAQWLLSAKKDLNKLDISFPEQRREITNKLALISLNITQLMYTKGEERQDQVRANTKRLIDRDIKKRELELFTTNNY